MTLSNAELKLKKLYPKLSDKKIKALAVIVNKKLSKGEKVGKGFLDSVIKGASTVANKVLGCKKKVEKWDYKPKPGEKHSLIHKNGCVYSSSFAGPGTHVWEGVSELLKANNGNISQAIQKSNFPSEVSRLGLAHDIKYVLATNSGLSKDERNDAIKKADEKFVKDGKKLPDQINAKVPSLAISTKLKAENLKVLAGGNRSAGDEKVTDEQKKKLEEVLAHLEQIGFGKVRPLRKGGCDDCNNTCGESKKITPKKKVGNGKVKPNPWLIHLKKVWNVEKPKGTTYKQTMTIAKNSYK